VTRADRLIAVVDDEAAVRVALGRLVRLAGYTVSAYASGEEFLSSLAERVPDCVILDVHMPRLSGLDVQLQLQADNMDLPIVFITASDDVLLARTALEAGAVRLLRKPFSNDDLLEAICAALGSAA
jgi:FixJ family two-component response regulator